VSRGRWLVVGISIAGAALLAGQPGRALGQPAPATPGAGSDAAAGAGSAATPSAGSNAGSSAGSGSATSACGAGSSALAGQSPSDKPSGKANIDVPLINAAVPDAPAFALLGVTPTQVTQPQTARELGAAAATVIGSDGKLHQGVAIEWTPYKTLGAPTLATYERLYPLRTVQLSLATSQGVGAGMASDGTAATQTDAAIGVRSTLWNPDDPVIVLRQRYLDEIAAAREVAALYHVGPPTGVGEAIAFCKILDDARAGKAQDGSARPELAAAAAKLDARHKELAAAEAALKSKWNQTALAVGGALGELFPDSHWKPHTFRGWAAWGTLAYGIGAHAQVIVTGRYHSEAKIDSPGDTSLVGARLVIGATSFAGFGELAWNWLEPASDTALVKDNWAQASVGFEIKLSDKTWLVAAFGGTFAKSDTQNDFFAASNFKWSFGDKTMPIGPIK